MQIPLSYAEDIIGIQGANIDYIRRTSGAILTVQESRVPDEIIVEIKGTSSQVQTAQQLIQDVISSHNEPVTSSYGRSEVFILSVGHYNTPPIFVVLTTIHSAYVEQDAIPNDTWHYVVYNRVPIAPTVFLN
ncbi:RNA-binding KH domain-containing protein PEPPER [Mucuna pruriens]|uniref:RNA-binding KH domain-containing protein PEPPER n=1 Tax=Mucuna pruriens TaxID=157652 RepID=A0A371EMI5_MUCPR|nr:RNA-binding KH domain-containing protein PEPPER [Mucuna pruriens]